MNSLSDLNSFSATQLEVTDLRGSKVIFDRMPPLQPLNQTDNIASTTVAVDPGIEIVEIINHSTANVRYRVTIVSGGTPLLTGSTISWVSIPAGLTLTTVGDVYTISGIETLTDWNAIKSFTWNLPANYSTRPNWNLDVAIIYYDSVLGQDTVVDWEVYDEDYYYIAEIFSVASMSSIIGSIKSISAALTSTASVDCPGSRVQRAAASLSTVATLSASALDLDLAGANLIGQFTISASIRTQARFSANIFSIATSSLTPTVYKAISNMTTRTYISNSGNQLFAISTPYIEDISSSVTFTIELSSANGTFGSVSSIGSATYSYSGTYSQVNSQFSSIYFWPTKNYNGNTTFNYKQYRNGVLQLQKTVSLNYSSAGTSLLNYVFESSGTWTPTYEQKVYMLMDVYAVGGGGNGWKTGFNKNSCPGGSGGQVVSTFNQTIVNSSYAYTIGAGASVASQNTIGGTTTFGSLLSATGGGSPTTGTVQGTINTNVYEYKGGDGAGGSGSSGPVTTGNNGSTVRGGAGGAGVTIFEYTGIAGGGGGGYNIVSTASTSSYTYNKILGTDGGTNWGSGGTGGYKDDRTFGNASDDIKVDAEAGQSGVVLLQLHL